MDGPIENKKYSLKQVARMFRASPNTIRRRALDGELPYKIDGRGHMVFTSSDLLPHLEEMIERNDRID